MGIIEQQVERARLDLAQRLGIADSEILAGSIEPAEFPNAALGAPLADEMSAQVITSGWRIRLTANDQSYEYRASERQLRLVNLNGENYRI